MEHGHKNTDCYFFYYSTCKKGDNCPFRHEPSALGCETMCSYWQQGNCLNEHCNFRHMELKKNRKSIACYWETQPGGCRKPHCSFMHKNARTITGEPINPVKTSDITSKPLNQEWLNRTDDTKYDGCSTESDQGRGSSEAGSFIGSPAVDPLIVKFEEESDNESVASPAKPQPVKRVPYCKTYEEIRLEEIQAESAAYYSYEAADDYLPEVPAVGKPSESNQRNCPYEKPEAVERRDASDFKILTLEEIRRRKKLKEKLRAETSEASANLVDAQEDALRRRTVAALKRRIATSEVEETAAGATESKRRAKVPPIRLKRSIIRRLAGAAEPSETPPRDEELSNANRKKEVEVRLCDSSTDEAQQLDNEDAPKTDQQEEQQQQRVFCDSLLNINEEEYLALDTASDDILKDIDAILKEKTPA